MASKLSISRAQVHVPKTCALCDSIQDVNWYCNDCQEALCDKCKEGHKRGYKTRNDDVVPIKEANKLGEAVLPEVCTTHRGKTCDLYCSDCNIVMCAMCFTEKHKQHTFKTIEEEIGSLKHYMQDRLTVLKSKLHHFDNHLSKRHEVSKSFKESVDVVRQTVQTQGLKLKAEIDSITDSVLVELSFIVEEEEKSHKQDCQPHEKNIKEITQLIGDVEQNMENMSIESLLELTGRLRTTIPLYDVATKSVISRLPPFMLGKLNPDQLKAMIGYLQVDGFEKEDIGYKKKEVDSKEVSRISSFSVPQRKQINSICPIDDTHAWMSILESTELIKVNKKGNVKGSVKLDFQPWCMTLINTDELLITCCGGSSLIHKLSRNTIVTRFANISPLKAWGISVSDSDQVFVTTHTTKILVLDIKGLRIRQISCGGIGLSIVCMTTGDIAVTTSDNGNACKETIVINKWDQIKHNWNGKLEHGQTRQCNVARDRFDRVFVPDICSNQVYILSENQKKAKYLLGMNSHVICPCAVGVDRCGHIWIGCVDGTVFVMKL